MTCPSELERSRALTLGADPEIEGHLAACPACRAAWDADTAAIELARELPVTMPPPARREEMRTAILAASATGPRPLARRRWLAPTALGAAAAVIVAYVAVPRGAPWPSPSAAPSASPSPPLSSPASAPASASLAPAQRGAVHPHPGARYVAVSSSPDEVIQLVEGAIDVDVQPLHPGERFRVLVGDAELEVRGTAFTVTASEQQLVDVAVQHGRVDLRPRAGSAATLTAGQSWHAAKPTALVEASLPQARPALPARAGSASPRSAAASLPPPASAQSRSAASSSLPGSPARLSAPPSSSGDIEREADATGASVERSYDQAWAALRASDFNRAASGFARVVLLAPDEPLVEDASFWRAVALARGQRATEARSAFRDFLDSFSGSPHAGEASAMLGWLLLDVRSYDEAAHRFTIAARDANLAVRRSARAGLDALARREP